VRVEIGCQQEVRAVAASNPTDQRLAELLEEVAGELRDLREQQRKLTEEVRRHLGTSSD